MQSDNVYARYSQIEFMASDELSMPKIFATEELSIPSPKNIAKRRKNICTKYNGLNFFNDSLSLKVPSALTPNTIITMVKTTILQKEEINLLKKSPVGTTEIIKFTTSENKK